MTIQTPRTFYMKEGDRLPALEMVLYDQDGNVIDLTEYTAIELVIAPCVDGRRIVDLASMSVKNSDTPEDGTVLYEWAAGDTALPGEYQLEVVLTIGTTVGKPPAQILVERCQTVPSGTYDKLIITPRL